MSLVLDASASLAWVLLDESTESIENVFAHLIAKGAWVPAFWRLEVAKILEHGVRRGRHDAAFRDATLADLAQLPILEDSETNEHTWGATLRLAAKHRLTTYDAAYLELALRREVPLATLDQELRSAARAEGLTLLGA
jgi:predicted nucleic acid-binding protein